MLEAVRGRPEDKSVIGAFGGFVLKPRGALAATDAESAESLTRVSRMIASSPALRAREVRRRGQAALELLEAGLTDYARKP